MFNLLDLICITFLILFYKTAFWAMRVRNDIESNEYHKNQKKYIEQVMFKPHYLYFRHKNYVSPLNFYGNLITFIFAVLFFINGIIYLYVCNSKIGEIIYFVVICAIVLYGILSAFYAVYFYKFTHSRHQRIQKVDKILTIVAILILVAFLIEKCSQS